MILESAYNAFVTRPRNAHRHRIVFSGRGVFLTGTHINRLLEITRRMKRFDFTSLAKKVWRGFNAIAGACGAAIISDGRKKITGGEY